MNSRTPSRNCCKKAARLFTAALLLAASTGWGQSSGVHVVSVEPPQGIVAKRGAEVDVPLKVIIRGGYHINSNAPAEDYLIPTQLTWSPGPLTSKNITYPKAESVKYEFSQKPLLVYSGAITVMSRLAVAPDAQRGPARLGGKLRYQACTEKACLAPRTLDVGLLLTIE